MVKISSPIETDAGVVNATVARELAVAVLDYLKIVRDGDRDAVRDARKQLQRAADDLTAILPDRHVSHCDRCGARVLLVVGCPDGAEICQACFDAGFH